MWCKVLFVVFCAHQCYCFVVNSSTCRTEKTFKYSIDELINTVFTKKISDDLDLDPCKAGKLKTFGKIQFCSQNR